MIARPGHSFLAPCCAGPDDRSRRGALRSGRSTIVPCLRQPGQSVEGLRDPRKREPGAPRSTLRQTAWQGRRWSCPGLKAPRWACRVSGTGLHSRAVSCGPRIGLTKPRTPTLSPSHAVSLPCPGTSFVPFALSSPRSRCGGHRAPPVVLAARQDGPDGPRGPVGERDAPNARVAALAQPPDPLAPRVLLAAGLSFPPRAPCLGTSPSVGSKARVPRDATRSRPFPRHVRSPTSAASAVAMTVPILLMLPVRWLFPPVRKRGLSRRLCDALRRSRFATTSRASRTRSRIGWPSLELP